jgi:protein KRI1
LIALKDLDLDGDWDEKAHDKQMASLYDHTDEEEGVDDEKPQWEDDINIDDIVPRKEGETKKKKKKKKNRDQDEELLGDGVDVDEMDADVERMVDDEEWDGTEEMRKRKLDEYMDDVYGLDFNDMVIPSRETLFSNADVKVIGR